MDEIRRVKEGGGGTRYTDQPKHASQTSRLGDRHDKPLLHALPLSLSLSPSFPFTHAGSSTSPYIADSLTVALWCQPSHYLIQATISHRIASRLDRPSPLLLSTSRFISSTCHLPSGRSAFHPAGFGGSVAGLYTWCCE